jgi:hypothetical protein
MLVVMPGQGGGIYCVRNNGCNLYVCHNSRDRRWRAWPDPGSVVFSAQRSKPSDDGREEGIVDGERSGRERRSVCTRLCK